MRLLRAIAVIALVVSAVGSAHADEAAIHYVHDRLDRLTAVIDQQGSVAVYTYDAVGNLLRIDRVNAEDNPAALAITFVSPSRGRVGASVQIFGKGFSETLASNVVRFNGVQAVVTEASPNRLLTTVPVGATTGYITVTVSPLNATSPSQFSVGGVLAITPASDTIWAGGSTQFEATEDGAVTTSVTWAVNGIPGGDPLIGTISTSGLYSAPSRILHDTVTITAIDSDDLSITANASVKILSAPSAVGAQPVSVVITAVDAMTVNQSLKSSVSVTLAESLSILGAAGSVSTAMAPAITVVSPSSGGRGATGAVLILTGSGMADATQVQFFVQSGPAFVADSAISVTDLSTTPDGTQATVTINIGSAAIIGGRVVRITASGATSTITGTGANVFTINP